MRITVPTLNFCAIGDDTMHIVDYIAISVLAVCMLWAGAMALHKAR